MRHAAIVSTGLYVPPIEITNDELRERYREVNPEFVDKLEPKSGILTRFAAPEDMATSDLALHASRQAIERAGISPEDIDLILVGTDSPDHITPSTSVILQGKLAAKNAGTFDVGCACSSFPPATATAAGFIKSQPWMSNILVVGAYMMRRLADPMDPLTFLYGDGAGAAIVQPSETPGILSAAFRADGNYAQDWKIQMGGTVEPANEEGLREGRHFVRMTQSYPPEVNEGGWPAMLHQVAAQDGFSLHEDVATFIFTPVRRRTIEKVMKRLELPMEKAPLIMQKYGYTGSACIPMALHDAIEAGAAKPGDLVCLVGSGVGYNQACVAVRLTDALRTG